MRFCRLLHIFWITGCGKLVLGASSFIRQTWESESSIRGQSLTYLHEIAIKGAVTTENHPYFGINLFPFSPFIDYSISHELRRCFTSSASQDLMRDW